VQHRSVDFGHSRWLVPGSRANSAAVACNGGRLVPMPWPVVGLAGSSRAL
jgi:hypothetical protein